jgi:nicotinate-nucleotide pyrophosphorylase (carboxylating)
LKLNYSKSVNNTHPLPSSNIISSNVRAALAEDIGTGDVTADLIDGTHRSTARIVSREDAVLCGTAWLDETFHQADARVSTNWLKRDGDTINSDEVICSLEGPSRVLLSAERTALNFLQTLSGTATTAKQWADAVTGLDTRILDTRKTIPGLRMAQKYAVACGGCLNHRVGLFDAILIKENHIAACGSVSTAVKRARAMHPQLLLEVEVENLQQLREALACNAGRILLDNFNTDMLAEAVTMTAGQAELEASGNITLGNVRRYAETGVDYISTGALTKHVRATDYSMLID